LPTIALFAAPGGEGGEFAVVLIGAPAASAPRELAV